MRSNAGDELVLKNNTFVELILPHSIQRVLTENEMAEYRRPFEEPGEDRRPTLSWPREIPLAGEPPDVVEIVQDYADWLKQSDTPKLFINAEPGAILVGRQREFCRRLVQPGRGDRARHPFHQEDSADQIGLAVADWLKDMS